MFEAYLKSPIGHFRIIANEAYITQILFSDEYFKVDLIPDHLKTCVLQLDEYFKGMRKDFTVPVNPDGTEFQGRVWNQLSKIPFGKTLSYIELARQLGDEKAVRAVGTANGQNPIPIIIPCHRVIGNNGSLTGYAGGLLKKQWLLEHEGAIAQRSLFF
ncbi:MAG: methylated-DNA--[protein]-cysteine S-methyltransferase [Bacteroidales bacterium]